MKKIISLAVCFLILISICISNYASTDDRLVISMVLGNTAIRINDKTVTGEKPFISGNNVYVPLITVLDSFGAEINRKERGVINIIYRDKSIELTPGQKEYVLNSAKAELPAPLLTVNKTVMIPLQFFKDNFDVTATYEPGTKAVRIVLENDGALSDLSFLTDGISKPRVGNSYFKWSINIPNGSRLMESSFNSKYIRVENELRGIIIEISISSSNGKKLAEYYDEVNKNHSKLFDGKLVDSSIDMNSKQQFGEFLYNNLNDEPVLHRIFVTGDRVYSVILTFYNEIDPKKIKANSYYKGIIDSFSLGYNGNSKDVEDLSKIKFGLAKYENYITFESGNKYLTWEINTLPEWDILNSGENNQMNTRIGLGSKEYIEVKTVKTDGNGSVEKYGDENISMNAVNFNPRYYKFIGKLITQTGDYKTYRISYSVEIGNSRYMVDESFILVNDLLYDITVKIPEEKYEAQKEFIEKTLDTLKFYPIKTKDFIKDMDDYNAKYGRINIGKGDGITSYNNKSYKWSMKIPGYWTRDKYLDESFQVFLHPYADVAISVEAVENNDNTRKLSDEEKFKFASMLDKNYDMSVVKKETVNEKGTAVRIYAYKLKSEENGVFAEVKYYVIDRTKYSYCFSTIIPDLYTSDKNLKEIQDIWTSFTVE